VGLKTCPNVGRQSSVMEENIWSIDWLFHYLCEK
jgi:hypothetical protein